MTNKPRKAQVFQSIDRKDKKVPNYLIVKDIFGENKNRGC